MEDTASRSGEEEAGEEQDEAGHVGPAALPSSTRQSRNQAEKQRRDKLNQYINELAILVPMVAMSAKKLDKTSILRLSASYLRMHQVINSGKEDLMKKLSIPLKWCQSILNVVGGVLLIVTPSGKIVFISNQIENLLGYQVNDLLGDSLSEITNPDDRIKLERNLRPELDPLQDPIPSTSKSTENNNIGVEGLRSGRRSFFIRLKHRAVSKSDQPHYEDVHVEGFFRTPPGVTSNKKQKGESHLRNDNTLFVAIIKPCREKRINAHSILEATKEEWISRHLVDGTIVFSDHRISFVSGYLSEEVSGKPAFLYMHSDDVRWVMIALRQMYYRSESYGSSCYRLLSKNGEFIYIRTHGYLELNEDNSLQSFICINSLVSRDEGEELITQMKTMFGPLVMQSNEPGTSGIADTRGITAGSPPAAEIAPVIRPLRVEDPNELQSAIEQLLTEVPSDEIQVSPTSPVPDQQFAKIAMESKNMPPVAIQSSMIGLTNVPCLKKGPKYNRPSVITPLPRTKDKCKRGVTSEEKVSVLKRIRPEETSVIVSERSVIRAVSREETGVQPPPYHGHDPPQSQQNRNFICTNDYLLIDAEQLNLPTVHDAFDPTIDLRSHQVELEVPVETIGLWENDVGALEEGVVRGQIQLEDRIHNQERQIFAIENELTSVPITNSGSHIYRSRFTHLKAEHRKQQQMLKTLQQDHHNIQHLKEHMNISDVGV